VAKEKDAIQKAKEGTQKYEHVQGAVRRKEQKHREKRETRAHIDYAERHAFELKQHECDTSSSSLDGITMLG